MPENIFFVSILIMNLSCLEQTGLARMRFERSFLTMPLLFIEDMQTKLEAIL